MFIGAQYEQFLSLASSQVTSNEKQTALAKIEVGTIAIV